MLNKHKFLFASVKFLTFFKMGCSENAPKIYLPQPVFRVILHDHRIKFLAVGALKRITERIFKIIK
jgi:hypothetical protein